MPQRRAVVTGIGAVTPLGTNVPSFWNALVQGHRGIARLTKFDPTGLRNETGGQVWDWQTQAASRELPSGIDEATQFLLAATREAEADAALELADGEGDRAGAILATNFGGSASWEAYAGSLHDDAPDPRAFSEFAFDTALDHLCADLKLGGPSSLISIACASGSASIGMSLDMIRYGRADVMVSAGYDALSRSPLAGLSVLRTMTADDILPFSANRSGTLFGEGAGALIIEERQRALDRGAHIYCEVLGSSQNNNAYHLTAPDAGGNGMIRVLSAALADAGVEPGEIDYINAHGTGTQYHDPEETHAIKTVLGAHAYEITVSSIKGAIGHLMGAAGAVEAVATAMAIETGVVPPTINDGAVDPEMDLDFVLNESRAMTVDCAASISAGIGGGNACVVFRRDPEGGRGR